MQTQTTAKSESIVLCMPRSAVGYRWNFDWRTGELHVWLVGSRSRRLFPTVFSGVLIGATSCAYRGGMA